MIDDLHAHALFRGPHGAERVDLESLGYVLSAVGQLILDFGDTFEACEISLLAGEQRTHVLEASIRAASSPEKSQRRRAEEV